MNNSTVKLIVINGIIAALYAALTVALAPISYMEIQFRLSEILVMLAFYNKKLIPGLVIGCVIANLFSPLGLMDVIFGSLATLLATILIYYSKNMIVAAFAGAIVNGIIIGIELNVAYQLPLLLTCLQVFVGELVVLLIAVAVFKAIEKTNLINQIKFD